MNTLSIVPKATTDDETKDSVTNILKDVLKEAESGDIAAVVVIVKNVDGSFWNRASMVDGFAEMIGSLEILKAEWIAKYLINNEAD